MVQMKKIGIITIIGSINFGNRLQNYALQESIKKIGEFEVDTIKNSAPSNHKKITLINILKLVKLATYGYFRENNSKRRKLFLEFDKNIKFNKKRYFYGFGKYNYDILVVGSDQVWNPLYRLSSFDLCDFDNNNAKRISYAASLGVDKIPNNVDKEYVSNQLDKFSKISVREEKGKELLNEICDKKIDVVIDPTLLLSSEEWEKMSHKPKKLDHDKYILNYFLGNLSPDRVEAINKFAKDNNCKIINILDKNDDFYESGPSEFLYLVKNAYMIFTDSFHSSVFSFIFDRPFVIFEREQKNIGNMNSRIDTLLKKFELKDRIYNNKEITEANYKHDYTKSFEILENEKKKCFEYLKNAIFDGGEK